MRSGIGDWAEEGVEVVEAVEEQNMRRGRGAFLFLEERQKVRRWCSPAIWSHSKERRRALKFTVQAQCISVVVVLARAA